MKSVIRAALILENPQTQINKIKDTLLEKMLTTDQMEAITKIMATMIHLASKQIKTIVIQVFLIEINLMVFQLSK